MQLYRTTKIIITFYILIYLILAVILELSGYRRSEIFPFFSWSLFATVPAETNDYSIRIVEYDGRKLENPVFFENYHELFPSGKIVVALLNVRTLGQYLTEGNDKKSREYLNLLKSLYPGVLENCKFEIVKRAYNPLERYKYNRFKKIEVIKIYNTVDK